MAAITPDIASLRASIERDSSPPPSLPPALRSLWLVAKAGGKPTAEAHAALTGNDKRNIKSRSGGPGISPKSFFGLIWTDQRLRRVQKAGRSNGSTGLLLCEAAAPNCGAPRRRVLQGGLRRHRRRHRRSCCFCCCRCHRCYQR